MDGSDPRQAPTVAAIDIGSNSLKLTVARFDGGALEEFHWDVDTVRLGRDLGATGVLADDRVEAALETLGRFERAARDRGADRVFAVATEAVRSAANGQRFIDRINAETGIAAEIVSGDREAQLSFLGLAATIDLDGTLLVVDIGGASTELILADDGDLRLARSLPLGSGSLTDRHVAHDPPLPRELDACRRTAAADIAVGLEGAAIPAGQARLVLAGGTGELLRHLADRGMTFAAGDIDRVLAALCAVPAAELAERISVQEARARVLPAGVAIASAAADVTRPASVEAAISGIRTGLLMEHFGVSLVRGEAPEALG